MSRQKNPYPVELRHIFIFLEWAADGIAVQNCPIAIGRTTMMLVVLTTAASSTYVQLVWRTIFSNEVVEMVDV